MTREFYILLRGDEDGNPLVLLESDPRLQEFLDDPKGFCGITDFQDQDFLMGFPDPSYWADKTGVLLKCEVVVPVPAGSVRLP